MLASSLLMSSPAAFAEKHKAAAHKTKQSSTVTQPGKGASKKEAHPHKGAKGSKKSKTKTTSKMASTAQYLANNDSKMPAIPTGKDLAPKLPPLAAGSQKMLGQGIGGENPKSSSEIHPVKANGIWIGSLDGKQAYRLGDSVYMDNAPMAIYTKPMRPSNYPQLPPLPVVEGNKP